MRVVFTGVSHWHLPLYLAPVMELADVEVVGVADPDPHVVAPVAERIGSSAWTDWAAMCDELRPDFAFVLGRHCDMAEVCRGLIERGIPFAVEKPAGISLAEVEDLRQRAADAGAFAAVPFVFRQSRMMQLAAEIVPDGAPLYLSFKFIAGSFDRYLGGSDWMLSRAASGGGCLLNLGIHFLDLSRLLLGRDVEVAGAMMSNALSRLDVEDHAAVLLRSGAGGALIETGYIYPAPHMTFDMHFSLRTPRYHLAAKDESGVELIRDGGEPEFIPMPMSNVAYYPEFVRDVLRRAARGERPVAGLDDLAGAMALLEDAYRLSPLPVAG